MTNENIMISAAEVNGDFARVTRLAEEAGHVVVTQGDRPRFLVIDLDREPQIEMTEDEKLDFVAARILRERRAAFEELAK